MGGRGAREGAEPLPVPRTSPESAPREDPTATASPEERRLLALRHLRDLDIVDDPGLTALTRLAAYVTGSRYAAVHLIDDERQYRIAAHGVPLGQVPRDQSMCVHVVEQRRPLHTPDASREPLFAGNPNTTGPNPVRLYAATPLVSPEGEVLGALCVFDTRSMELTATQLALLDDCALQVSDHLRLRRAAAEFAHQALHDPVTGCANRVLLLDRLDHSLAQSARRPGSPALLLLDLDGFKEVNDTLGHAAGDRLLREVAQRLLAAVRPEDTVARLGGDEFVVLVEQVPSPAQAAPVVERVSAAFAAPFHPEEGVEIRLGASVGVHTPAPGEDPADALRTADLAMYRVKRRRKPPG